MMVRSIRGRLVIGTLVLTLLSVSVVGVVALLLMQRYMVQQERAYLTANAEAIARQAAAFMTPIRAVPPLQQLAQTAAFLSDASVRIVDAAQVPLADSGATFTFTATAGMSAAPLYFQVAGSAALPVVPPVRSWEVVAPVVGMLDEHDVAVTMSGPISATGDVAAQVTNVIMVQRSPSIWGDRLTFEAELVPGLWTEAVTRTIAATTTTTSTATALARPPHAAARVMPEAVPARQSPVDAPVDAPVVSGLPIMAAIAPAGGTAAPGNGARAVKPAPRDWLQAAGLQATGVVTAPIRVDGKTLGYVEVQRATGLVDEPLGAIRRALAIAAGASSLLALAVGLVMSRTLTTPIHTLAQTAAAMSNGDLTARAPVVGRDELAALARQFNQMADALHHSFAELAAERDTLRRFVADASHELRTPITALRTFNELLQGPARTDQNAQAEFLAESEVQIARLEWITRNLLDLSRWEGGMATLVLAPADVGEVVATTVLPFRRQAQERNIELLVVIPDAPVVATVDAQRLALVVANLLDNALKFTAAGGQVEVGVQAVNGQGLDNDAPGNCIELWVADTGIGIDAAELLHIFDRFYRSPRATQAGSGLGLAIVEHIVNAHGAKIDVVSQVGAGSRFTLRLPVRPDQP